jgi:hypothetical protein
MIMDNLFHDMTAGVATGLITATLILIIKRYWSRVIVPWFQQDIRRTARLFEGKWNATEKFSDDKTTDVFSMELHCHGRQVTGEMVCVSGPDKDRVYELTGLFQNLILTLSWIPKGDRAIETGTITVQLVDDARKLSGHGIFYSPKTDKLHTSVFIAARKA